MAEPSLLIVDDDQVLVDTMRAALESLGYAVATAYDGAEGVRKAQENHPSVIFLDFYMPAAGGDTAYERLRAAEDTAEIPVIFTTGAPIEEIRGKLRTGPKTYFLRKPISISQIQTVLSQVLGIRAPVPKRKAAAEPPAPPSPPKAKTPPPSRSANLPEIAVRKKRPSAADAVAAFVKRMNERIHQFEVRVTYADTDKMGVIYYANYFKYFEMGRTELIRSLGVRYRDLERDRDIYLPVVKTHCDYLAPAHYDDLLMVRTWLSQLGVASLAFTYEIFDRDRDGQAVARGFTRHAIVGKNWKPTRVPADMREILKKILLPLRPS